MASAALNPLEAALRRIAADLADARLPWALVGGLAVSARAEPRTTRDVDVAVLVSDDRQAERLVLDLQSRGYQVSALVEQVARHRLATVRLSSTGASKGVVIDLLFASSGIEPELVQAAESIEILPGLTVPLATTGHLLALKALARNDRTRPQDWDDMRALLLEASPADVETARRAVELIEARGYHRGKRLRRCPELC